MLMFNFHIAFSLELIALALGAWLLIWSKAQKNNGAAFAKLIGIIIMALAITNMACTSYYSIKYWSAGYYNRSMPCPMMQQMMAKQMMQNQMQKPAEMHNQ